MPHASAAMTASNSKGLCLCIPIGQPLPKYLSITIQSKSLIFILICTQIRKPVPKFSPCYFGHKTCANVHGNCGLNRWASVSKLTVLCAYTSRFAEIQAFQSLYGEQFNCADRKKGNHGTLLCLLWG